MPSNDFRSGEPASRNAVSEASLSAHNATTIQLLAGTRPDGQAIIESLPAVAGELPGRFLLLQSPLFVAGVAQGDVIDLSSNRPGECRVHERSGQLAIRVFSRGDTAALADNLTPAVEKLGGRLDVHTERALVYSIHVAVGFREIEAVFDELLPHDSTRWSYGNVYDPQTGTPLHWWDALLNP